MKQIKKKRTKKRRKRTEQQKTTAVALKAKIIKALFVLNFFEKQQSLRFPRDGSSQAAMTETKAKTWN